MKKQVLLDGDDVCADRSDGCSGKWEGTSAGAVQDGIEMLFFLDRICFRRMMPMISKPIHEQQKNQTMSSLPKRPKLVPQDVAIIPTTTAKKKKKRGKPQVTFSVSVADERQLLLLLLLQKEDLLLLLR